MNENLKDILSHLSTEVDQETLLLYLQGKLSAEKQHELEKSLVDNEFAADALEGLQNFKDKKQLQILVDQLQKDLRRRTQKKKALQQKLKLKSDPILWIAVIIILLLIVLGYVLVRLQTKQ